MSIFDFSPEEAIGTVFSVDTGTVTVSVKNIEKLRTLQVNRLVALRSSRAGQHLLGMVNRISRRVLDQPDEGPSTHPQSPAVVLIENVVRITLIGTLIDREGARESVFRRTLETVPEIDADCFLLEGSRLTQFMRSISKIAKETDHPLSLGTYAIDDEAEAWIDGNKFFQRHAVIVGSTGSGKSWTVARILEQVASLPSANAILFDIHGEYKPLSGNGITHLRIAGPADLSETASLDSGIVFLPYWMLTYEEMLALLLDRSDQNAPNQAMLFSREVSSAKRSKLEKESRNDVLGQFTVDSPVPYSLNEVISALTRLDRERVPGAKAGTDKEGPFANKLTRFIQRLEAKQSDRRLGFLFSPPSESSDYDWLPRLCRILLAASDSEKFGGVKIIDFSEVPSDVLPLVVGLVARVIFSVQQWTLPTRRHPVALICDEAHLYIRGRVEADAVDQIALRSFERIAKEGRKYGVGLAVVSQRPSEVNRTVLSQCSNFVAMRLANAEDQTVIRRLLPDSLEGFVELLPILDVGEALVVGDASILPSRIRVNAPKAKPDSSTIDFWTEWSRESVDSGTDAAVDALRRQSRMPTV